MTPSLSIIERIIFLKQVSCFRNMSIDQLKFLASACEEEFFSKDNRIFNEGDPGGAMYVIVMGRVAVEHEDKKKGKRIRLATLETLAYFGEMSLFDQSRRSASVLTIQDTLLLKLRREPLAALMRQQPDISLAIINDLCDRIRATSDEIARQTRALPRQLQRLFDQLEEEIDEQM